jgi:cytolysin (calcineurin-like family phosphatase)
MENWVENVGALKQLDDQQWKDLNVPVGLTNEIKK